MNYYDHHNYIDDEDDASRLGGNKETLSHQRVRNWRRSLFHGPF